METTTVTPVMPNPMMTSNPNAMLHQMQSILQLQMFRSFSTGNFVLDTVLQLCLMTLITYFFSQVKTFLDTLGTSIQWVCVMFVRGCKYLISKWNKQPVKWVKHVDVPYISDNRKINELYKAVSWYLSTNCEMDFLKESGLQYVYENQLTSATNVGSLKSSLLLTKLITQNRTKTIKFLDHDVHYELTTDLITIYADVEKKKENFKVRMWVEMLEHCKVDVLDEFCKMALFKYVESLTSKTWKQQVYINKDDCKWSPTDSKNMRKLETIVLRDTLRDEIREDLDRFLNSEEWYQSLDIPFNRGYLFYGRPGTGKTSLIRGLSLHFKRHIHFLMLQNIPSDAKLLDLLKDIKYDETILVIEDVDAMVSAVKSREFQSQQSESSESSLSESEGGSRRRRHHRRSKKSNTSRSNSSYEEIPAYKKREAVFDGVCDSDEKKAPGITLSGLLNALDGVVSTPGRVLIMTTNHPEVLDDALIRPGRCDAKFQFDYCNKTQIRELYRMFFHAEVDENQLNNIKSFEYSPSHVTGTFLRYRNEPHKALLHLDDYQEKVVIQPMIDVETKKDI